MTPRIATLHGFSKANRNGTTAPAAPPQSVVVRVRTHPGDWAQIIDAHEIFAWLINLETPPESSDRLLNLLTADEQSRAWRYKIAKAREQFVIGRGLLRRLLGDYLAQDPRTVPLTYLPSGKPVLADAAPPIHFNVTHTDGWAVVAIGYHRMGVDIERIRPVIDVVGLVGRYFSRTEAEEFRGLSASDHLAAFFRGWTCKEAVIKAAGATVAYLADFDVELNPRFPPRVKAVRDPALASAGWALAEWRTSSEAAVAFAVDGASHVVVQPEAGL
ncbi:MAG: 4'-phosphopantetheinyl transferase superfamily protein [Gemmataceae bacterium]|nr:4'-phosphopantetheinyl transferase superfamily protein [Gemmata sp.]MDW8199111.1 4'-phosphopantetheinyl transferase superfamily protein [Gemmataceae bacterium]